MMDWYSPENWPPTAQKELNPVVDVEDVSMINMHLIDAAHTQEFTWQFEAGTPPWVPRQTSRL